MRKFLRCALLILAILYCDSLCRDMAQLHNEVIRLHVVGASDTQGDQVVKLKVKDAINQYLQMRMQNISSTQEAKEIIRDEIPSLQTIAQEVLVSQGFDDSVSITLEKEAFPKREYDTFTLPSGIYESLRVRIGPAQGQNWWCVVFPTFCLPAAGEDMRDVAAGAGFSEELTNALTEKDGYEIRFFLLDWLGQLQIFCFEP